MTRLFCFQLISSGPQFVYNWTSTFDVEGTRQTCCLWNLQPRASFPSLQRFKKRIHGDECTSATPVDADFQPYVSMAPPSKVLQWKQTLTERKRLDTTPKYPKRCKEKYQKNLFRLSFKPDLANCGRLTKIDFTHWRQRFSTTRNVFYSSTGRAMHLGWTWAFNSSGIQLYSGHKSWKKSSTLHTAKLRKFLNSTHSKSLEWQVMNEKMNINSMRDMYKNNTSILIQEKPCLNVSTDITIFCLMVILS